MHSSWKKQNIADPAKSLNKSHADKVLNTNIRIMECMHGTLLTVDFFHTKLVRDIVHISTSKHTNIFYILRVYCFR